MVKVEINGNNSEVIMSNGTTTDIVSECATIVNCLWVSLKDKEERLGELFMDIVLDPDTYSEENTRIIDAHESRIIKLHES